MLQLYNTLNNQKEDFKPIETGQVRMYTCGPTVYDFAHIGNFRAYIFEDLLRRYLAYKGFEVQHVMNITDVDDKTIRNSQLKNQSLQEYTEKYTTYFYEDLETLNCLPAHTFCKATDHIDDMVTTVETLIEKGHAYKGNDGSIYFNIASFETYGRLANLDRSGLQAGARVNQDEYEKDAASDFALWKAWSEDDGEVYWETSLGKGRPGWHIECSAMASRYLGNTFDLHCGGVDLVFPHHENEIAQSEAATGKPFVNYWVHNEHLLVDGRKMSKSAGNFYTLRQLFDQGHKPGALRYALLSVHYRQQLNFTIENLNAAEQAVQRMQNFLTDLDRNPAVSDADDPNAIIENARQSFELALDNDLNISEALAAVFNFIKEVNKASLNDDGREKVKTFIENIDSVLGLFHLKTGHRANDTNTNHIEALIQERNDSRTQRNFARADEIRDELKAMGIVLEDGPGGTTWKQE